MIHHRWLLPIVAIMAGLTIPTEAWAQVSAFPPLPVRKLKEYPPDYNPNEPIIETLSLGKATRYLDVAANAWTSREVSCGRCHANYPYMLVRPLLPEVPAAFLAEERKLLEARVVMWKTKTLPKRAFQSGIVTIALSLALHDAQTTDRLQPSTREALELMWTYQQVKGTWHDQGTTFPPAESDQYATAVLAALAAGVAPDDYAHELSAEIGLERLRSYFEKTRAPSRHHQVMRLWASLYVEGLLPTLEREQVIKDVLAQQRSDGGWSFTRMAPNSNEYQSLLKTPDLPSDGYGTGFVIYVLRQAGIPATHPQIVRGIAWLRSNQRVSGRWFTPSPDDCGKNLYIYNAGTAFAVLALKACE